MKNINPKHHKFWHTLFYGTVLVYDKCSSNGKLECRRNCAYCGKTLSITKHEGKLYNKKFIPITLNFDHSNIIGHVEIKQEFEGRFPNMTLSPGYITEKNSCGKGKTKDVVCFGLVPTKSYIDEFNEDNNA